MEGHEVTCEREGKEVEGRGLACKRERVEGCGVACTKERVKGRGGTWREGRGGTWPTSARHFADKLPISE